VNRSRKSSSRWPNGWASCRPVADGSSSVACFSPEAVLLSLIEKVTNGRE
jgi:hypothetical protein